MECRARGPSAHTPPGTAAHGLDEVVDVRLAYDWQRDRVKGYGWVQFKSAEATRRALRLGAVNGGEGDVMFLEASTAGSRSA